MKPFTFKQMPAMMIKFEHLENLIERLPATAESKDEILTIQEASKLLNLSLAIIYSKASKREIPVNKKGKRIYFYRNKLMEYIKSGRVSTYSEMKSTIENRSKI